MFWNIHQCGVIRCTKCNAIEQVCTKQGRASSLRKLSSMIKTLFNSLTLAPFSQRFHMWNLQWWIFRGEKINFLDSRSNKTWSPQTNVHKDFMNIDPFLLFRRDGCEGSNRDDTWVLSNTNSYMLEISVKLHLGSLPEGSWECLEENFLFSLVWGNCYKIERFICTSEEQGNIVKFLQTI